MLSEKYAVDFLKGIDMVEADGATKLWGQGRIATGNTPENFQEAQKVEFSCGLTFMQMSLKT